MAWRWIHNEIRGNQERGVLRNTETGETQYTDYVPQSGNYKAQIRDMAQPLNRELNQQIQDRAVAAQRTEAARQNPESLREVAENIPIGLPEGEGVVPLAYTLATETELELPEYQVAGFTPEQQQAFEQAQALQGVYQPYLEQGYQSTMQGIGAMGGALRGTQDLAGQIPGAVEPGQEALGQAARTTTQAADQGSRIAGQSAQDILQAARSSDPATRRAAREILASGGRMGDIAGLAGRQFDAAAQGAQGVAADVAANVRGLGTPLAQDLAASTAGARQAGRFGTGAALQGISGLRGSTAMYSPEMIEPFMNKYEDVVVQQALEDISRAGQVERQNVAAQGVGAGAFGGARQGVAEQELARNILEQQGRTAGQLRSQGFESAAGRSQQAFEQALGRQQQAAQLTGQLGQIGTQAQLNASQLASANAQALAQTGLNIEQLAAQTGLSAQELAGQLAGQRAQVGLSAEQGQQAAAGQAAGLRQQQAQLGMQGAQSAGQLGMQGQQMRMAGAQQAGNLGLQQSQLGLQGIQAGLGAQQQAAGLGQGIAGLGQQQLGFGQAAQQMGQRDVSTQLQIGQQQQAQQQAQLDAQRMNEYQQAMMPYQQLAFASDIATGAPTGITSVMSQPVQSPSAISQLGGLAFAGSQLFGEGGVFA